MDSIQYAQKTNYCCSCRCGSFSSYFSNTPFDVIAFNIEFAQYLNYSHVFEILIDKQKENKNAVRTIRAIF